jgi:hypothetical protein
MNPPALPAGVVEIENGEGGGCLTQKYMPATARTAPARRAKWIASSAR